jgi:hypothetical protein
LLALPRRPAAAGCLAAAPPHGPADYAAEKPVLDLRPTSTARWTPWRLHRPLGQGGAPLHRADDGTWQGDEGVLDERFHLFSDGKTERRVWRLTDELAAAATPAAPTTWWARPRPGARQRLNWRYTLALPVDGKVYEVQFDDWMYLMDDA